LTGESWPESRKYPLETMKRNAAQGELDQLAGVCAFVFGRVKRQTGE